MTRFGTYKHMLHRKEVKQMTVKREKKRIKRWDFKESKKEYVN